MVWPRQWDRLGCMQKLNIADASLALGISQDVIRRRLRSGEIPGERVRAPGGFRWLVEVEEGDRRQFDATPPAVEASTTPVEEILRSQVQDLRDQLDSRTREISELHQLLAARALNPGKAWWRFWA